MPVTRRNRNLQQRQKAEALVKGAASQQPLPAFGSPADRPETAVQDVPCQPVFRRQLARNIKKPPEINPAVSFYGFYPV
jgi:hypothetical protein